MDSDSDQETLSTARDQWKRSTTALERVHQTIEQTTSPKTANDIADEARVSEPTARKHLNSLVEVGTATAIEDGPGTTYTRNEDTRLYQRIRDLSTEYTRETLLEKIQEMKQRIRDFEDTYDAVSPEDLATSLGDSPPEGAWEAVSAWQTTERNLHIAQAAINYSRARDLGAATQ